jgi:hypothetical protein
MKILVDSVIKDASNTNFSPLIKYLLAKFLFRLSKLMFETIPDNIINEEAIGIGTILKYKGLFIDNNPKKYSEIE